MQEDAIQTNSVAVASLACGVISMPLACLCCYGFPFNLIGLVLGVVALVQIRGDENQGGQGLAIGGIVTSLLSVLLVIGVFASFGGLMFLGLLSGTMAEMM